MFFLFLKWLPHDHAPTINDDVIKPSRPPDICVSRLVCQICVPVTLFLVVNTIESAEA
jgi:hypothetical protein